jgi:hypothetical protein
MNLELRVAHAEKNLNYQSQESMTDRIINKKRLRASSDNLSEKGENNSAANENVWSHVVDDEVTPLTHTITLNLNLPGKLKTFINQSLLEKSNSKTRNTSLQQF